jgi:hypothetical protein
MRAMENFTTDDVFFQKTKSWGAIPDIIVGDMWIQAKGFPLEDAVNTARSLNAQGLTRLQIVALLMQQYGLTKSKQTSW